MRPIHPAPILLLLLVLGGGLHAQQPQPEATSLLGQPLYAPEIAPETRARLEENLAPAKADYKKNPDDVDAIIWLGRRTAYLGRYREAIAIYSEGIEKHPRDPRFYRHRGHRYLTVREISNAIADLERAARLLAGTPDEIEPDGAPNRKNIPRSTTQTNIWYHLGLAYYLLADHDNARRAFTNCLELSGNDDMLVASSYWLYLTLRRLGEEGYAQEVLERIRPEMDILENTTYHALLLLYKGLKTPESLLDAPDQDDVTRATLAYGVGNWYLHKGKPEKARATFQKTLEGKQWAAFGYLAAEADLARGELR
ncbi:MAG: tetratricopeptide repeat protein [Acidobacteria bacterium]|nr:tetratricopeptide repeat protein [Acidobacteriota bacterium]